MSNSSWQLPQRVNNTVLRTSSSVGAGLEGAPGGSRCRRRLGTWDWVWVTSNIPLPALPFSEESKPDADSSVAEPLPRTAPAVPLASTLRSGASRAKRSSQTMHVAVHPARSLQDLAPSIRENSGFGEPKRSCPRFLLSSSSNREQPIPYGGSKKMPICLDERNHDQRRGMEK